MFANVVTKVFEQIIPARVSIVQMLGGAANARFDDVSFTSIRESFGHRILSLDAVFLADIKTFHDECSIAVAAEYEEIPPGQPRVEDTMIVLHHDSSSRWSGNTGDRKRWKRSVLDVPVDEDQHVKDEMERILENYKNNNGTILVD